MRFFSIPQALLLAALTVGVAGCTYDDYDDYDHDHDGWSRDDNYRRGPYGDRDDRYPDRYDDRYDRDRWGMTVPKEAHLLERGKGELSTKVDGRGVIYLYDANDRRVVWSGRIRDGQRFTVDPRDDRAAIDGQTVYRQNLVRDHEHRIYLEHQ